MKAMVVGFCSTGDLCYSDWWVWDLRILAVSGKWNVSRDTPRLYGWLYKILRLSLFSGWTCVVVIAAGSQSTRSWIESNGQPIFDYHFNKFEFGINGDIKFWDPRWGHQHWWFEFSYRYDGILICFKILILWTLCGKPMSGRQKALFY